MQNLISFNLIDFHQNSAQMGINNSKASTCKAMGPKTTTRYLTQ
jgi:hypothetical protein